MTVNGDARADLDALLDRLGLEAERPSVEALARLHCAYVEVVPYETVWIHAGERWDIDPAAALRRIARHGRGGYCYHLNGALALVLETLGYRVTRHVGGVHDAGGPNESTMTNHLVLIVHDLPTDTNPGGRWYVDAGLGDGLHEPLPLQPGTHQQGPLRFIIEPVDDGVGDWHFEHDPTGSFAGMSFCGDATAMDVFAPRHVHLSTSPESSFAGTVTAQLRRADGTDILRGCVLRRRRGDDSSEEVVDDRAAWLAMLADQFGIRPDLPPAALDALWARVAAAHQDWLTESAG